VEVIPTVFNRMIVGSKVRLREKRITDAVDDYAWETDPELAELDAAVPPAISFSRYVSDYTSGLRYLFPSRYSFAIETMDGKHIGNCLCYQVDKAKGEAELGIIIGDRDYWNKGYGTDAVATLLNYVLRQANFDRVYLKTLDWNIRAQRCFQKCGFTPCGELLRDGHRFVLMEVHRREWERSRSEF